MLTTAVKSSQIHSEKSNDLTSDAGPCDPKALLKVPDLLIILKIHKNTLYELCQQGVIPCLKVGRQYRFLGWKINKWLAKNA